MKWCRSVLVPAAFVINGATVHAQPAAQWTVTLDVTYAVTRESPLSRILGITALGSGEAWMLDATDPGILHFGADGTYVGRIGGIGEGPGEFRRRTWAGTWRDTLWVYDAQLNRVTWLASDGGVRTSTPPRPPAAMLQVLSVLGRSSSLLLLGPSLDATTFAVVDSEGAVIDTVPMTWGKRNLEIAVGPFRQVQPNPFSFGTVVGVAEDSRHFAVVNQPPPPSSGAAYYHVCLFNAAALNRWCTAVRYRPEPLDAEAIDEWLDRLPPLPNGVPESRFRATVREELGDVASVPPVFARGATLRQSVLVENSGNRVWIRREPNSWDIVTPDGIERVVRIPENHELHAVAGDYLWAVTSDAFDVPVIRRFHINRE